MLRQYSTKVSQAETKEEEIIDIRYIIENTPKKSTVREFFQNQADSINCQEIRHLEKSFY